MTADQSSLLQVQRHEGVATLTLQRPESKNALSAALAEALTAQLDVLRRDEGVRAVVLTGSNGNFCSGGDVKDMGRSGPRSPEQVRASMARYRHLTLALLGLDKPLVAALDGVAYGAGLSIALTADLVLVSERVRLAMVFHRIGLVPDCGAWYTLPRAVGLQRAKELILSAREFGADEAVRMGLALEVLPAAELLPRAQALAHSVAQGSALAFSLSKQALQASLNSDVHSMLDREAAAQALAAGSEFNREAVRRFAAREPALFQWPAAAPTPKATR